MEETKPTPQDGMAPQQTGLTESIFGPQAQEPAPQPAPGPDKAQPEPDKAPPVAVPPKEEPPAAAPSPEPEYLDLQAFGEKKVKVKIDGQEMEVPFREVVKGYQTDQHLSKKGQRIAEEKQRFERDRNAVQPVPPPKLESIRTDNDPLYEVVKPYLEPLKQELAEAKQVISSLTTITGPVQYQQNLKALDVEMRKAGFSDFMEYVPRIETELSGMDEESQKQYDSRQGFETLYLRMKVQEKGKSTNPDARPVPKMEPIPHVESGSPPTNVDDSRTQDTKLLERARETGNINDWARLLAFRNQGP